MNINPFTTSNRLSIVAQKLTDNASYAYNSDQDKTDNILLHKEYLADKDRITKIVNHSKNRIKIAALTNNAKSLLLHIIFKAQPGSDIVDLKPKSYMAENRIKSLNTYKAAIKELTNIAIYPTSTKNQYFINPNIFFCGNRIKLFPNNVKISKSGK